MLTIYSGFFKVCKYRTKEVSISPTVFNFPSLFYLFPFLQVPTHTGSEEHNVGNREDDNQGCITCTLASWFGKVGRDQFTGHSKHCQ